jgi:hypothetical protein
MKYRELKNFRKPNEQVGLVYFAQRMEELTFDYSLDSYKAPTVNVPGLISEALSQLHLIRNGSQGVGLQSVEPILDELRVRLHDNMIVRSIVGPFRDLLGFLQEPHKQIISKLDVLRRELSPQAYINQNMKIIIFEIKNNNKNNIDFLARELVTSLQNSGMSRRHIYQSTVDFFFEKNHVLKDENCLNEFFKNIFPHHHKFTMCFKIGSLVENLKSDNFASFSMEISDSIPEPFLSSPKAKNFKTRGANEKFVIVSGIEAFDQFSAIANAEGRVAMLQNLFRTYHHKSGFDLGSKVLSEQKCCSADIALLSRERSRMSFVNDDRPKKAAQKLDYLLKNTQLPRGKDGVKFFSVTEFHSLSLESKSVENQLLNLWISLETLIPSRQGSSKINSVISGMLPITGLNYIRRIIERLAFDLLRWNRPFVAALLRKIEPNPAVDAVGKVLRLCALKANTAHLEELFEKLENFELLRNRIYKIHQKISDPSQLKSFLESHQKRVEWQIMRIYRIRNSIVHNGRKPDFSEIIVDCAHDYFDQALEMTTSISCGINGFNNFDQCFDYVDWEYVTYLRTISRITDISEDNVDAMIWRKASVATRSDLISQGLA